MFVADDLAAWLVGLLADAGRSKLIRLALGSDQERALRHATATAIESTAAELDQSGAGQAERLAMVISEVFREPTPVAPSAGQATLLEALQAGMAEKLSALDDAALTGTGRSSSEVLGLPGGLIADSLARHLVREIMRRGSQGGPLTPLADQLNQDVTHMQGQRLEGMLARLADQVMTLGGTDSATMARWSVSLLPRPAFLVGREELLAALDAQVTPDEAGEPQLVVLCGLGGAGKTSLALEYAHRHLVEVGVAWQLPAGNPTVLAAGFVELAAQLGVRQVADARDPVASVHGALAAIPDRWLLVFDNAPDQASIERFLPPAGRGRVLVTSQNQNWPHGRALQVPVLGTDVSAGFLISRTGDQDQQAAAELARELGGLPLALEQAAAYVLATGGTLVRYLDFFRRRRADMLHRGEPAGYSGTVATTWALAFARLEETAPEAAGLLRLLACYGSEAVPLRLLLQFRPGLAEQLRDEVAPVLMPLIDDPLAADDAIAALRRYSLVTPAANGAVSVHRLVQMVTADEMPAESAAAWRQAAAMLIEAAIPGAPQQPDAWHDFAALLPHAQAALADSDGLERLAAYLGFRGSYQAAFDLQRRVLRDRELALGPEHPSALITRANLARWSGEAGDAAGARDEFAALAPALERVLGPEHPTTLTAVAALARFTGAAGDAAAARDQLAMVLPAFERVLGPQHPDTLITRASLAISSGNAGDAAGARDQYAALLPVEERVLGPQHPETLTARANLAAFTGDAGDAAGARDQYAALLPVEERVLGPQHPSTLATRANLARWSGEAGDAAGARDQLAAVLPAFQQALGAEHPNTLTAVAELARFTGAAGDAAAARDQLAALLPVEERILGPEHPGTLSTRANLAAFTGQAGDAAGAREQYAALLPLRARILGPEHPETLFTRQNLAWWTSEAGDAAGARDQYAALLPVEERVLGPRHPGTLAARTGLLLCTRKAAGNGQPAAG